MDDRNKAAAESLRNEEMRVANARPRDEVVAGRNAENGETENARATEEQAGGLYTGGGLGGKAGAAGMLGKAKGLSRLKKWAPAIAIAILVFGVLALISSLQSLLPVAVAEMLSEKFNSIDVSTTTASDSWLDTQLNLGVRETELTDSQSPDAFALSSYQVQQFEDQGIEVVNVSGCAALLYKKSNRDDWYGVVGSNCGGLTPAVMSQVSGRNVTAAVSTADAFTDIDFKYNYATASKTWRGGNSGWYDEVMTDVTKDKLAISRNRWAGYEATSSAEMTEAFATTAASVIKPKAKDTELVLTTTVSGSPECPGDELTEKGLDVVGNIFVVDYDEDINPIKSATTYRPYSWTGAQHYPSNVEQINGEVMTIVEVGPCICILRDEKTGECLKYKRTVKASDNGATTANGSGTGNAAYNASINNLKDESAVGQALTNRANHTATIAATKERGDTCAKVDGVMSVYSVLSAYENIQFLNLASGYLEAVDKMKAGLGAESPVNEYAQLLTLKSDTVMYDDSGNKVIRENKSAMESEGMAWLFSNGDLDTSDLSLKNVNVQTAMTSASSTQSAAVFQECGYVNDRGNTGTLTETGMDFIPILGKAMDTVQKGIRVNMGYGVTAFFSGAMTVTAKRVTNMVIQDVATDWIGEDRGNALVSGAEKYISGNATSGGQSPGDQASVVAYLGQRETVLAQEADYERATKSPFDVTSRHTFLGTLAYSLIPMAYSGGGIMSILTDVASITSSAVTSILPSASAVNINETITSSGNCPIPNGTYITTDAYCNAYTITDVNTIYDSPVAISLKMSSQVKDGEIGKGSDLARYVTYCGQRTSSYNLKDSTIVNYLQDDIKSSQNIFQRFVNFIINILPFIKTTQTELQTLKRKDLLQWATGEACMATAPGSNDYWGDNQYYQRYSENERLLENMNPGYTSPVTKLAKAYVKETTANDDTLEGVIARFAGMTVDEVNGTMDLIAYYLFLDGYDASVLYAFGADPVKVEKMLQMDVGVVGDNIYNIYWTGTEYADVRNRVVNIA